MPGTESNRHFPFAHARGLLALLLLKHALAQARYNAKELCVAASCVAHHCECLAAACLAVREQAGIVPVVSVDYERGANSTIHGGLRCGLFPVQISLRWLR